MAKPKKRKAARKHGEGARNRATRGLINPLSERADTDARTGTARESPNVLSDRPNLTVAKSGRRVAEPGSLLKSPRKDK